MMVTTWDVRRVLQWYASVTFIFGTCMGPLDGSAYQIACSIWGKVHPNCMIVGATSLLVVSLILGFPSSSFVNRLRVSHGKQCAWGTAAVQGRLNLCPSIYNA